MCYKWGIQFTDHSCHGSFSYYVQPRLGNLNFREKSYCNSNNHKSVYTNTINVLMTPEALSYF